MSKQTKYPKVQVLGLELDRLTIKQGTDYIVRWAKARNSACYVVKPYVEFIDRALKDRETMTILNNAELALADGVSLQWAASYLQAKPSLRRWLLSLLGIIARSKKVKKLVPELSAGLDFTQALLAACAENNLTIWLVGSPRKRSINHTARYLSLHWPGLHIAGTFSGRDPGSGKFSGRMEKELAKKLKAHRPHIILFGLSFPKQEQVMASLSKKLDHGVLIGEGGSFDYKQFGGTIARAPKWLRKSGLEWLWRLIRQPQRIGRQLAIPRFMWKVYRSSRRR